MSLTGFLQGVVGANCLSSSLTGFLKGLHALLVMLHGLLSTQQEQVGARVWLNERMVRLWLRIDGFRCMHCWCCCMDR
jgi:hypothetical protein